MIAGLLFSIDLLYCTV